MRHMAIALAFCAGCLAAAGPAAAQFVTEFGDDDAQQCYINARNHYFSESSLKQCDDALTKGMLSPRDKASTLVNRGIILTHLRRLDDARRDFNSALDMNSELGEAYLNRGNTYIMDQDYEAAVADYTWAIELESRKLHAAYYNRGLAYEAMKDLDAAYKDYVKASELAPEWPLPKERIERYDQVRSKLSN